MVRTASALGLVLALAGCSDEATDPEPVVPPEELPTIFGGERPAELFVPESYDGSPAPLLILVHGYSASGLVQDLYLGLKKPALERGFLYAHPDGTTDLAGNKFWNASDACCGWGSDVDDVGYLRELVAEISAAYAVDEKRIYFAGHSNGSFMSYRMACEHPELVAAIAGIAGAMLSPSDCAAAEPVHVLHVHGTEDDTILHEGGELVGFAYPGAAESVAFWAAQGGCDAAPEMGAPLDLVDPLEGAETAVVRHQGCAPGGAAELWSIEGAGHIPAFNTDFSPAMLDFLLAHPKP